MQALKGRMRLRGEYEVIKLRAMPRWMPRSIWLWMWRHGLLNSLVISRSGKISNLIMLGTNTGLNLLVQHLHGTTTFPLVIDNASIGTGTTTPTGADTDLETPVLENIVRAIGELQGVDTLYTEWFITDDELTNGTYNEFGLFCGAQIFCRSIISPAHVKGSGEDTLIPYTIIADNGEES